MCLIIGTDFLSQLIYKIVRYIIKKGLIYWNINIEFILGKFFLYKSDFQFVLQKEMYNLEAKNVINVLLTIVLLDDDHRDSWKWHHPVFL